MKKRFIEWLRDSWALLLIAGAEMAIALLAIRSCGNARNDYAARRDVELRETHRAWVKLHPQFDMSFEEWNRLKSEYLLPDQKNPNQY